MDAARSRALRLNRNPHTEEKGENRNRLELEQRRYQDVGRMIPPSGLRVEREHLFEEGVAEIAFQIDDSHTEQRQAAQNIYSGVAFKL